MIGKVLTKFEKNLSSGFFFPLKCFPCKEFSIFPLCVCICVYVCMEAGKGRGGGGDGSPCVLMYLCVYIFLLL